MSRWGRAALATLLIGCGVGGRASVVSPRTFAITAERRCEVREGALFCAGVSGVGWPYPEDATVSARRRVGETRVAVGGTPVAVTLSEEHGCALLDDGAVRCWGANGMGQLGSGVCDAGALAPQPVRLPGRATSIATLGGRTCARLEDGTAACWGGVGHLPGSRWSCRPRRVRDGRGWPLGGLARVEVDAAIDARGRLWVWGSDFYGQVSRAAPGARRAPGLEAVQVREPPSVREVASTGTGTCVLDARGEARCWGAPVGRSVAADAAVTRPTRVRGTDGAIALSCDPTSCCVHGAGALRCWGELTGRVRLEGAPRGDAVELRVGGDVVCVGDGRGWRRCFERAQLERE